MARPSARSLLCPVVSACCCLPACLNAARPGLCSTQCRVQLSRVAFRAPSMSSGSIPLPQRMVLGAVAGMGAATCCHPLDVLRVQMQTEGVQYKGTIDAAVQIFRRSGLRDGLYAGVSAAYLRA